MKRNEESGIGDSYSFFLRFGGVLGSETGTRRFPVCETVIRGRVAMVATEEEVADGNHGVAQPPLKQIEAGGQPAA